MSLKKKNIPDICTSLCCDRLGCDYCRKCSHAYYKGSLQLSFLTWSWEFNPRTGPAFNFVPRENNPIWKFFDKWVTKEFD